MITCGGSLRVAWAISPKAENRKVRMCGCRIPFDEKSMRGYIAPCGRPDPPRPDGIAPPPVLQRGRWPRGTGYAASRRRRSAFAITDTDERLMAAAASMGDSSQPKNG